MYFESFPTIFYDANGDGTFKDVKNLLRRVGLRTLVKTNVLLFDTYEVKEGETPEMIAHKLYGDSNLHWIILMINEVTDRYHQWPMTVPQFLDFINDKYDNPDGIHHYETSQDSGDTKVKIEVFNEVDDDAYTGLTPITNREYEENEQDKKRQIRLVDPSFVEQFVDEFKVLMEESVI